MQHLLLPIVCIFSLTACDFSPFSPQFQVTEGGLHYHFLEQKDGEQPQIGDEVHYNLAIWHDKKLVERAQKKEIVPLTPKKNPVFQAFQFMGIGDSLRLALLVDSLPKALAQHFPAGDTLFMDLKITKIRSSSVIEAEHKRLQAKEEAVKQKVGQLLYHLDEHPKSFLKTASGLRYHIEKQGEGKAVAKAQRVALHYAGFLLDGEVFESTFLSDTPKAFYFGERTQTVKGFTEGLQLLRAGAKATFIIPSHLAYGETEVGNIPANSDLVIYVELIEVH